MSALDPPRPRPPADLLLARRPRARPPRRARRAPRRARARRRDRRARRARHARAARRARRAIDGERPPPASRPSSTRTCTCARPGRSTRRTSRPARAPRPPAATARSSRCRTPIPCSTRAPLLRSLRDAAAREARVPVGFMAAITRRAARRAADRDGRAARGGRARLHRRRPAGRAAPGMLRRALHYQRLCGGVLALHEEDPTLSRGGRDARGRRVAPRSASAGSRSISESTMVARDAALAGYEDARVHFQHLAAPPRSRRVAAARRAAAGQRARSRRTTCC